MKITPKLIRSLAAKKNSTELEITKDPVFSERTGMMKQSQTEWREIPGCTKYVISEFGSVRHIKTNTTRISKKGRYIRVYMDNGRAVSSNKVFNLVFPEKDMPTWKTEEWKSIPGFPRYLMHPKGKVWDRKSKTVLVSFLKYKQKHFNLFDGKNWLQKKCGSPF